MCNSRNPDPGTWGSKGRSCGRWQCFAGQAPGPAVQVPGSAGQKTNGCVYAKHWFLQIVMIPGIPGIPRIPGIKLRLQSGTPNFVGRRGTWETYPSQPSRPPFKFDDLKSRRCVYAKRSFSQTKLFWVRDTHISEKRARRNNYIHKLPISRPSGRYLHKQQLPIPKWELNLINYFEVIEISNQLSRIKMSPF